VRLKHSAGVLAEGFREFQTNSREVEAIVCSTSAAVLSEFQTNSREVEASSDTPPQTEGVQFQTNSREVEADNDGGSLVAIRAVSDELS